MYELSDVSCWPEVREWECGPVGRFVSGRGHRQRSGAPREALPHGPFRTPAARLPRGPCPCRSGRKVGAGRRPGFPPEDLPPGARERKSRPPYAPLPPLQGFPRSHLTGENSPERIASILQERAVFSERTAPVQGVAGEPATCLPVQRAQDRRAGVLWEETRLFGGLPNPPSGFVRQACGHGHPAAVPRP